jgi:hypothetical protein
MAEPRDTLRLAAVPRLMVFVVLLWAAWLGYKQRHRRASGTVVLMGTTLANGQFAIEDCKKVDISGAYPFAADFVGSGKYDLRLTRRDRDDDVQLSIYPKGNPGAALPIDQRDCSQWRVGFFWEDVQTLNLVGGGADFTCTFAGGKIDATIFGEHCRP